MVIVYYPAASVLNRIVGLTTSKSAEWAANLSHAILAADTADLQPSSCVWMVPGTEEVA